MFLTTYRDLLLGTSGGVIVNKVDYKRSWVSSSLIGCPIYLALWHIEAKSFINYYFICFLVYLSPLINMIPINTD